MLSSEAEEGHEFHPIILQAQCRLVVLDLISFDE